LCILPLEIDFKIFMEKQAEDHLQFKSQTLSEDSHRHFCQQAECEQWPFLELSEAERST